MAETSSGYIYGVEFFRLSDKKSLDVEHYFECLDILRPRFERADFKRAITRFYFNYITVPDDNGTCLRFVYDTSDPVAVQAIIRQFAGVNTNHMVIFNSSETKRPDASNFTPSEGEDLRFRDFLYTNTQIFLGASKSQGYNALRDLILQYRFQALPQRIPPEAVLEPALSSDAYFQSLRAQSLDARYWADLMHLFNNKDRGLHFLVNMSAIADSPYDPSWFGEQ